MVVFLTPEDGEKLIFRDKEAYDGAIPSGNGIAMMNLIKLGRITGVAEFEKKADMITQAFSESIARSHRHMRCCYVPSDHLMKL